MAFRRLGLASPLAQQVASLGYREPTPIQQEAIPPALAGRDVIGCAQTGTGKTAAFVLPLLQRINGKPGIKALVITPTRELADQIQEMAAACAKATRHRVAVLYGGVGYGPQEAKLRAGVDVLVATPGRLLDMMARGCVNLAKVEILVLDEADRMLDMGFWPDVRRIITAVPPKRQTLLFSATMSPNVLKVIGDTLNEPVTVQIGKTATPVKAIDQSVYPVDELQKTDLLFELLKRPEMDRSLIFVRTKHRANRLTRKLQQRGLAAGAIHSGLSQPQRQRALADFKAGRHRFLLGTDIVSRGIDVEGVSHVVNFDIPSNPEDYVHRIGRTARAGRSGTAISLLTADQAGDLRGIEALIGRRLPHEDLPGFDYAGRALPVAVPEGARSGPSGPSGRSSRRRRPRGARPRR